MTLVACDKTKFLIRMKTVLLLISSRCKIFEARLKNFTRKKLKNIMDENGPKMAENEVESDVDSEINSQSKFILGGFLAMKTSSFKHFLTIMCF